MYINHASTFFCKLAISLSCMVWAVTLTKSYIAEHGAVNKAYERPDFVQQVIDQMAALTGADDDAAAAEKAAGLLSRPFRPSLLNTVVFLVETAQQISVILVNYRGRPFMKAATENIPMLLSLAACCAIIFTAASEVYPPLNGALRLVPLPNDDFRLQLVYILTCSVFGTLVRRKKKERKNEGMKESIATLTLLFLLLNKKIMDRISSLIFARHLAFIGYVEAYKVK